MNAYKFMPQLGLKHAIMSQRTLAIVPARGGSKRIRRKNLREVGGKSLLAHAIEDAEAAAMVDEVLVSTEDEEIARVARDHGAYVPFRRPQDLARDDSPIGPVITDVLDRLRDRGDTYDVVSLIQTTSPLRHSADIDQSIKLLLDSHADSVISISKFINPPQWAVIENETGFLEEFFEAGSLWGGSRRSQELDNLKHPNGAIFAAWVDAWDDEQSFYTDHTVGYEMPPIRSFDVDEPWELDIVRAIIGSEP